MLIDSLLDTDLYKFTMMQVVLHHFPAAQVEYRYRCRAPQGVDMRPCVEAIRAEIDALCGLRFSEAELSYLGGLRFIRSDFIDFLRLFHLPQQCVTVDADAATGQLQITVRGAWLHTILFEMPVLAIVNEVYSRRYCAEPDWGRAMARLDAKIDLVRQDRSLAGFRVADYGTRRRFSKAWHEQVIARLVERLGENLAGTSNVHLAMRHGIRPLGTMGHEYLQACQALGPRLRESQIFALETWAREYRGDLGIALSDVYGADAFMRDFDMYFCKLFDGARHDSGDPFTWGERMLDHYRLNRVDPHTKTLVFSDNLSFPLAIGLFERFNGRCQVAFGVDTDLTNDVGCIPLQHVLRMVRCNGQPVAKVTDTPDKTMCEDPAYLAYLRQVFSIA
ncbi:nicotinate phosphoribosyltransferase [Verticiella sediminum]|uniref:Nicotinate phosphoribosyltransferase n=1 Tax=Verticiella sediminum TaxID=1247510 RepID=A0A556AY51_9BURK|nr:nicotinate phosphoribosyltransferase [Verticiella sediminum]TSH97852.1 nicotinate phosphoribosyltransferase [Verticiella sediminum]